MRARALPVGDNEFTIYLVNFGIKDFRVDLIKTFRVLWRTPEQHLKKVKCHIWGDSAYQVNDILSKLQTVHKHSIDSLYSTNPVNVYVPSDNQQFRYKIARGW